MPKLRATATFTNDAHEGHVRRGQLFETTRNRARVLEQRSLAEPAQETRENGRAAPRRDAETGPPVGPSETKPDGPSETKEPDEEEGGQSPEELLEGHTKKELYEIAQNLDVSGRSSMDKDELAAAILESR